VATATTYSQTVEAMRVSHKLMVEQGIGDPDLDVELLNKPKWGNHSLRRYADRQAQKWKQLTLMDLLGKDAAGCKAMINYVFGWDLTKLFEDMQEWYAGKDAVERAELSLVTLMS